MTSASILLLCFLRHALLWSTTAVQALSSVPGTNTKSVLGLFISLNMYFEFTYLFYYIFVMWEPPYALFQARKDLLFVPGTAKTAWQVLYDSWKWLSTETAVVLHSKAWQRKHNKSLEADVNGALIFSFPESKSSPNPGLGGHE